MKKVLLIALCFAIPMVGFAQKKKKKGAEPEVVAPVVETLSDEECLTNLSLFHESVKNDQFEDAYATWLPVYQSCPTLNKAIYTDGAILPPKYPCSADTKSYVTAEPASTINKFCPGHKCAAPTAAAIRSCPKVSGV